MFNRHYKRREKREWQGGTNLDIKMGIYYYVKRLKKNKKQNN